MDNSTLKQLIKEAHENAVKHGFYDDLTIEQPDMPRLLMLIICEIAEFMEADRKARWFFNGEIFAVDELTQMVEGGDVATADFVEYYKQHVKGCAEEELADICIRCFDTLGFIGADEVSINHYYEIEETCIKYSVPSLCYSLCREITDCLLLNEVKEGLMAVIKAIVLWCKVNGVALMLHIKAKMLYNQSRPYKHGKAY